MMTTREAVGQRILNLCKERGISPNKLGVISGVDPSTITSIFYGKSKNPGITTIKMLCDGLEISLFEFFDDPLFKTKDLDDWIFEKVGLCPIFSLLFGREAGKI